MCDWTTFATHIKIELRDLHHMLCNQSKLLDLHETTLIAKYNEAFLTLMMEVLTVISV